MNIEESYKTIIKEKYKAYLFNTSLVSEFDSYSDPKCAFPLKILKLNMQDCIIACIYDNDFFTTRVLHNKYELGMDFTYNCDCDIIFGIPDIKIKWRTVRDFVRKS